MSIDSAVSMAWDALKNVVVPIKRQFGFVRFSKSYARDLLKEVERLADEVERVHNAVEVAKYNLQNVYNHVNEWQASAEKALKEAQALLGDFEKATKTCCYGTLPDLNYRYQFSKKAQDKIEDIRRLFWKISELREIRQLVHSATASASSVLVSVKLRDDGLFESRALIIQEIMDALADNSNSVVGVYGMGGVGKSALLVDVERRIREQKSFDLVAKADVSENPDIKRIQGEIAIALGLDIQYEDYVSVRAALLHRRLEDGERKKMKVLIILDNLWKGLDLKSVGIPCGHDNKVIGCKLLLTSRFQDVLQREMSCDRDFRLEELKDEEAKRLFERTVGDKVHDEMFKPLVDEAIHKCAGLPFLIIATAKLFKDADLFECKDVLKHIETSKNVGISEMINSLLRVSYDYLEEEMKLVLRLCVICGVSEPSLENLVRYGMGLGLFQENSSMEEARDMLSLLIRRLQASSFLLVNGNVDGFKVHDLVRGFVASVVSRDHPFLVLRGNDEFATHLPKDKLKSCMAICFPYIDMKELPDELDCPELRIFLLSTENKSLEVPDSYFNSMRKLKVLNLTGIRLKRTPLPFQFLENLCTLCLDGCLLEDVAIIGELKGLQILSFMNSKIHRLPKEIEQLMDLRLLDLNNCSRLQIIEPGVLGSLIKLEELYMENSFDQWNAVDQTPRTNACLIELNNLMNLCTLHVSILDPSILPEDLNVHKLKKYRIRIGDVWHQSSYKGSRILKLKLNPIGNILQKACLQTTIDRTDDLYLDGLNKKVQSICELSREAFPNLKHLYIQNSPSLSYILERPSHTAFKTLESLLLKNIINLEKISHNHIFSKSFRALKVVRVESCDKMEVLFPLSLGAELPHLEEIGVVDCYLMREIIEAEDYGKVELHNLHELELRDLPNINNFFSPEMPPSSSTSYGKVVTQVAFFNGQQVSIPSLESLTMAGLPNLKDIWSDIFDIDGPSPDGNIETFSRLTTLCLEKLSSLRCIWNKNPYGISRFHNLKQLKVFGCNNLEFMFFPSMVKSLAQLRELMVRDCKKMESIIMEEEGLGMEISEALAFPMLTCLCLEHLESLTCFSCEKRSGEAGNLDAVKSCSTAFFNEKVTFPSLETLNITCLDSVKMIWDNQVAVDSFHNLKSLCVHECNKLVNIVPSCILGQLSRLESLVAKECDLLELVFELQPLNHLDGHPDAHSPLKELELYGLPVLKCVWNKELHLLVKFQCLCSVRVSHCKSLTSLFPVSSAIDLMQLEELKIIECGIVELFEKEETENLSINAEAIGGPSHGRKVLLPFPVCFQRLKTLDVSDCDGFSSVFMPIAAGNLLELTKLRISNCKMLTEIISDEGGEGHVLAFNQLKYLELEGLTGLRCFSSGGFTLIFRLLEVVIVKGCPNMKFFSDGPIEAPELERVRLSTGVWFWKGNLNVTIQNMFEENWIRYLK